MPSFEQLWQEKYLPRFHAQQQRESEARDRAFLDLPYTVCGEEVRQLTAGDLFVLQAVRNPFVVGGRIEPAHIAQFVWSVSLLNNPAQPFRNEYRKGRMIRRLGRLDYEQAVNDVNAYIDDMTLDLGARPTDTEQDPASDRRPLLTCFLAPLLVTICDGLKSASDPATGRPLLESPLPRLLQYRKVIEARTQGRHHKDYAPSDALLVECAEEYNRQLAEEKA